MAPKEDEEERGEREREREREREGGLQWEGEEEGREDESKEGEENRGRDSETMDKRWIEEEGEKIDQKGRGGGGGCG